MKRNSKLLDLNFFHVRKCLPVFFVFCFVVFFNHLQFKILTLIFFSNSRLHFLQGSHKNVNLGVSWETYVDFLKCVDSLTFSKYCKNFINLNNKKIYTARRKFTGKFLVMNLIYFIVICWSFLEWPWSASWHL